MIATGRAHHRRTRRVRLSLAVVLPIVGLMACGAPRGAPGSPDSVTSRGGGIVVSGVALIDGKGSVLDALRGKIPSMRIQYDFGKCPHLTFRNHATYQTQVNPHVFVDGTRATDTCILETIQSHDVEAVEVYPTGVTGRPGYGMHAHGIILVFMRS